MTRRFLIFSLAAGTARLGRTECPSGHVHSRLSLVGNLEFSWTISTVLLRATPLPADLNVTPFGSTGITFSGSFRVAGPAAATLPVRLCDSATTVTALSRASITHARNLVEACTIVNRWLG